MVALGSAKDGGVYIFYTRAPRKRIPTRPGPVAKERRLDAKKKHATLKKLRGKTYE